MIKKIIILLHLFCCIIFLDIAFGSSKPLVKFDVDSLKTINAVKDTSKSSVLDSTKVLKNKILAAIKTDGLLFPLLIENSLSKKTINKLDYRYTGNIFSYTPFGYLRDFGFTGQPNEILIYGQGFNNSSYLSDGISINNRITNSFNSYLFQSESIDTIEILPLTEGFLYGTVSNPASINFIPADFYVDKPYTRMRFYQAANKEGFIDGIFNSTFGNRLGVFAEFTNQSTNYYYKNSEFGEWLASVRLRYLISEKINLIASYRYANTNTQLNGGINYDSIRNTYSSEQINQVLYDNFLAPVNYINRYQKISEHNFSFKVVGRFIEKSPSLLTFYYQTGLTEFRQNDSTNKTNLQSGIASIKNDDRYKTIGSQLDQSYNSSITNFRVIATFERNTYTLQSYPNETSTNSFSLSAKLNLNIVDSSFYPSVFGRYSDYNNSAYTGVGADLLIKLNEHLNLFAGISEYQKPANLFESFFYADKQKNRSIDISARYKSNFSNISTGFFSQTSYNSLIPIIYYDYSSSKELIQQTRYIKIEDKQLKGLNLKFDLKYWKILVSSNTNFYFNKFDRSLLGLPEFTSNGGIYYVDTLFQKNLHLKAGLNYSTVGSRGNIYFDFEKSISSPFKSFSIPDGSTGIPSILTDSFSSEYQLDFFLAGQIQDNAIVYFTFENLLNRNYFIVPYYPMRASTIRFGIAWEFFN